MNRKSQHFNRRHMLKGAGVTLALPLLRSLSPGQCR